jgi:hypothetical protein
MIAKNAFEYAKFHGPSDKTRDLACEEPFWAFCYANEIDKKSHEQTRKAVCVDPEWAYKYALKVDCKPRVTENYENYEIPKYPAFT